MKTYLVRWMCKDGESEQIVGMVKAKDLLDLWMSVDEIFNPHEMQYLAVKGDGGVLLHNGELTTTDNFMEHRTFQPRWRTFVDLAGGERLFGDMYKKWHAVEQK